MTNITKAAQQALGALFVAYDQTCSVGRPKDWKQIKDAIDALSKALQDKAVEADQKAIDWHAVTLSLDEAHDESLDGRHGVARAMLREVCANLRASLPTQPAAQATPSRFGSPELQAMIVQHATQPTTPTPQQAAGEPLAWLVGLPNEPELGEWFSEQDMSEHGYTSKPLYTHPAPGVPEIDYTALIHAAWGKHKYAQGTGGCIAFKHGAEWFRDIALTAAQAKGGEQ